MNDTIIIRKATKDDLPALLRFEQGVVETERPFDPTLKSHPNFYYDLKQMIKDPRVHLVVAEYQHQPIGSGYAYIQKAKHYLDHEYFAYLGFMWVEPEWRGKKVNRLIIDELTRWSLSKGIAELRLEVYVENLAAIKAYEKAGFKQLMVQMRRGME